MADINTKLGIKIGLPDLAALFEVSGVIETGFNNFLEKSISYSDIDDDINSPDAFIINGAGGSGDWKPTGLFVKAGFYSGFSFWACPKAKPFYSGENNGITTFLRYEQHCTSGNPSVENDNPDYFIVYNLEDYDDNIASLDGIYYLTNTNEFNENTFYSGIGASGNIYYTHNKTISYPVYSGSVFYKQSPYFVYNSRILRLQTLISSGLNYFGEPFLYSGQKWTMGLYGDYIPSGNERFKYYEEVFWLTGNIKPRDLKNYECTAGQYVGCWNSDFDHDPLRGPRFINANRTSRWVMSMVKFASTGLLAELNASLKPIEPPYLPGTWLGDEDYFYSLNGDIPLSKLHEQPKTAWQQGAQWTSGTVGIPTLTPVYNIDPVPEWPVECEYFAPTILASEFDNYIAIKEPLINAKQLNIYNDINNLTNTGILYSGRIYDNEYLFRYITGVDLGNGLTGKVGLILDRNNANLEDTFSITTPTTYVTGAYPNLSGVFQFVKANEGFNYEVQYTRNLSSGWLFTGVDLQYSLNQANVESGFTRVEYLLPLSEITLNGSLFFRVKIQKIEYLAIGKYTVLNITGFNLLNMDINNINSANATGYLITPSGSVAVLEQFKGGGCNN